MSGGRKKRCSACFQKGTAGQPAVLLTTMLKIRSVLTGISNHLFDNFLQGRFVPGIYAGITPADLFHHVTNMAGVAGVKQTTLFDHPETKNRVIFNVQQYNVKGVTLKGW